MRQESSGYTVDDGPQSCHSDAGAMIGPAPVFSKDARYRASYDPSMAFQYQCGTPYYSASDAHGYPGHVSGRPSYGGSHTTMISHRASSSVSASTTFPGSTTRIEPLQNMLGPFKPGHPIMRPEPDRIFHPSGAPVVSQHLLPQETRQQNATHSPGFRHRPSHSAHISYPNTLLSPDSSPGVPYSQPRYSGSSLPPSAFVPLSYHPPILFSSRHAESSSPSRRRQTHNETRAHLAKDSKRSPGRGLPLPIQESLGEEEELMPGNGRTPVAEVKRGDNGMVKHMEMNDREVKEPYDAPPLHRTPSTSRSSSGSGKSRTESPNVGCHTKNDFPPSSNKMRLVNLLS